MVNGRLLSFVSWPLLLTPGALVVEATPAFSNLPLLDPFLLVLLDPFLLVSALEELPDPPALEELPDPPALEELPDSPAFPISDQAFSPAAAVLPASDPAGDLLISFFLSPVEAFALAFFPAAAAEEDLLLPELKAPILAPLKSTVFVLLILVPRFAAIRMTRVFSSAADIIVINTNLYLV